MTTGNTGLILTALTGIPSVQPGDDLTTLLGDALARQAQPPTNQDVLVVSQKIVSKAEGTVIDLGQIEPSTLANEFATQYDKDPRLVEVVLRESRRVVRMDRGILVVETKHGFICANAGVDASNVPGDERVSLLPVDPDLSARRIRSDLKDSLGLTLGVIISDTFGRPWRMGNTDIAIGVAGINPLLDYTGQTDINGYTLRVSVSAIADEIASAAELVAGKLTQIPVAIAKGYPHVEYEEATARSLVRDGSMDLFR